MKKVLIAILSCTLLFGMSGMAVAVSDGTWTELYTGGGPGMAGDTLSAVSNVSNEWLLSGMTLSNIISSDPWSEGLIYHTLYTGGTLTWGSSYADLSAVVDAYITSSGEYDHGFITLTAPGLFMTGALLETGPLQAAYGHYGTISDVRVPEPATMLLLGLGLAGLAGLRRKMK
jgi:hypothetical protein